MTPGSRSSSGAEDKRAVPWSARAAAPGIETASPRTRLRPLEQSRLPRSQTASLRTGLHPRSEAVSPGSIRAPSPEPGCNPNNRAASPGTRLLPRGRVLPSERDCVPRNPAASREPGDSPEWAAVPVPAAGSAGRGSRTHLPPGTPASPACRLPRVPGPPPAPPEGEEEEDTDQHGPRRSGFSRTAGRGLRWRGARAAAGARGRPGWSASAPRPGSRRWAAMARSAPPCAFGTAREPAWEGGAAAPSASPAARAGGHARPRAGVGPWAPAAPSAAARLPLGVPRRRRTAPLKGETAFGAALRPRLRALSSLFPPPPRRGGSLNWLPLLAHRRSLMPKVHTI